MYQALLKSCLVAAVFSLAAVEAVASPACQRVAPAQKNLTSVRTAYLSVPAGPLEVVYASQPGFAFVTFSYTGILGVLNTTTFPPSLLYEVPLPPGGFHVPTGISLTTDGAYALVASGPGAVIFDTAKTITNSTGAIVGTLNGTTATQKPGDSAFHVASSLNDEYVFVQQEYGFEGPTTPGSIDVFKLKKHTTGNVTGTPVGFVSLGYEVTDLTFSRDGSLGYATSEQTSTTNDTGLLTTLNIQKLEADPSSSVLTNASAGCSPVRSILSSDGKTLWVTARESNMLLAFDAAQLTSSNPDSALIASIQVGTAPVGLTFAANETRILTADSNRFGYGNTTGLSVVDVQAALLGSADAVLGRIPTGLFPREFSTSHDNKTILVTNFNSAQVQAIDVSTIP